MTLSSRKKIFINILISLDFEPFTVLIMYVCLLALYLKPSFVIHKIAYIVGNKKNNTVLGTNLLQ